jgi:glycosyltransferase involved in cell wall biosynthesis
MIFILFFVIAFLYSLLIIWYWNGWKQTPHFQGEKIEYYAPLSIIVPYRNASSSLIQLLDYFEAKNHLPFEVLLIDDFSEQVFDLSNEYSFPIQKLTLEDFNTSLTPHKNNKKEAIDYGISKSNFPYILCTDSDVLPSENWLEGMMYFTRKHKPKFATGIHQYLKKNSFLNYFLALEQDNYTAISCAGIFQKHPTMCNGANMIFEKSAYDEVGGYEGLLHINGGDDMLLLHRIQAKFPKNTHFIKSLETAVFSEAAKDFKSLFFQRKRWLSKSFDYENKWVGVQMFIALSANLMVVFSIIIGFYQPFLFFFVFWKMLVDSAFLLSQQAFFNFKKNYVWFGLSLWMYPFYVLMLSFDFFKSKLFHK